MRIAVVGSGVAGLVAARLLSRRHEVVLFEADARPGGHVHTVDVDEGGRTVRVDTGFIVFNQKTYPGFCRLLEQLGCRGRASEMSFSASIARNGVEYNGTDLDRLFAQRRNLLRPSFWRMVRDILRFYREAGALLEGDLLGGPTLGEWLERGGYSRAFVEDHIVPMGAAVWSAEGSRMLEFPARSFARFFANHGFLQVEDRPQWYVVEGASRHYTDALLEQFPGELRLGAPVRAVERVDGRVRITAGEAPAEDFDRAVMALHSDQALAALAEPTAAEREVLGGIPYQENDTVLHTDASVMPRTRRAWAAWNYHVGPEGPFRDRATVTYWMNRLQGLDAARDYFVTLNRSEDIDPAKVLRRMTYHHPVYTEQTLRSQQRWAEIDGAGGVHYCGAYWFHGFHEDGVRSALRVAERFSEELG